MKRPADWLQKEFLIFQRANHFHFFLGQGPGEDTIIRSYERIVSRLHRYGLSSAAYARIHHYDVDRSLREKPVTRCQRERAGSNVSRRDLVGDVNDGCVWVDAQDHAPHCSGEPILFSEICD